MTILTCVTVKNLEKHEKINILPGISLAPERSRTRSINFFVKIVEDKKSFNEHLFSLVLGGSLELVEIARYQIDISCFNEHLFSLVLGGSLELVEIARYQIDISCFNEHLFSLVLGGSLELVEIAMYQIDISCFNGHMFSLVLMNLPGLD
jgi:hypothetical protein